MSKTNKPQADCEIAVIGLGSIYPGANSPLQLWENILARRRQFREMPDVRLPNREYYDPDPLALNKTYQNKAAVIDGYDFNWLEKKIPKQTFESTDIVHWLALDTALQAIHDAGFNRNNLPSEKTGVILGNTLTGEFTRSNQMLLRWPFVRKTLRESARRKGLTGMIGELETTMEAYYKSVFHPVTEDTLAGGLANTIAGRICNFLDIHGGGYIVDGACSSSLLAIVTAANFLQLHQMDMVIAGGVDISLDTFELIGFAKTGALTTDEMRVYDKNGRGFLPGEGCGMVILKRLEDAIKDNNPIYAVIDGWGISSDGKGGITAPSVDGQSRALIRARQKAGISPLKLSFIEGHGTGTTVGDRVELEAISKALNSYENMPLRNCGVTSFKSIVGHTKAAAGIGAFIKTTMALNRRVVPPTANVKEPNPVFNDKAQVLYPLMHGQVKDPSDTLYAGVSAMGFGGINSHVILHSGSEPFTRLQTPIEEKKLIVSNQTCELFLFAASDKDDLIENLISAEKNASGISYAEMTDLAFMQNSMVNLNLKLRAAVIAETPVELQRKIRQLIDKLNDWDGSGSVVLESDTLTAGFRNENVRLGAVFPGQGSQKINMARKLVERYDWAKEIIESANDLFLKEDAGNIISLIFRDTERAIDKDQLLKWQSELKQTNVAQPAITLASIIWLEYLKRLGVRINCVSGHSLGELTAFYVAGLLDFDSLLKFSVFRGKSMARNGSGSMASLQCSADKAEKYINRAEGYVTIANINAPEQTVVSGDSSVIKQVIQLAQEDQVGAIELPVSAAFHSKLIADVANDLEGYQVLKEKKEKIPGIVLVSSVNGNPVPENIDLNAYFSGQAVSKVDFISAVLALRRQCDIILEIGPGKVLTGLISSIADNTRVLPVEPVAEDDLALNVLLGNLFVSGCDINVEEIYKNRLVRPFIKASQKNFIVNPLERPFPEIETNPSIQLPSFMDGMNLNKGSEFNNYLKVRSDFIREVIDTDFRYFSKIQESEIKKEVLPVITEEKVPVKSSNIRGNSEVSELLYRKIQEMTGFDTKMLNVKMRLLDDLNLDSIKSASLINGMARILGLTGKVNATILSNSSLSEIIDVFLKILEPGQSEAVKMQDNNTDNHSAGIIDEVYQELAKRTGFPREALSREHKLLDDLNMDSIKAGAFISHLIKKFGNQKKSSPTGLANAKIDDIIKEFSESTVPKDTNNQTEENFTTSWTNSYSVLLKEEPLNIDEQNFREFWKDKSLIIVHADDKADQASKLVKTLEHATIRIKSIPGSDLHLLSSFENCCILMLIPDDNLNVDSIQKTIRLLSCATPLLNEMSMLGFLQFNDGMFLKNKTKSRSTCAGVVSFAASIHHEIPGLKIRVVETDKEMSPETAAMAVMQEFLSEMAFDVAGYDMSGIRRKMEYQFLPHESVDEIQDSPGSDDVVIATGGARGITAECMFTLSKKSRCKTALVGSSSLNSEIEAVLERYKKESLQVNYYQCDITDGNAVNETVRNIIHDFGTITAVFHGAGKNIPRKAEKVTYEEALAEIAPKMTGFFNLSSSLKDCDVRYFIALTSIIGVTGMPGNSWYAFSNENLDLFLRTLGWNSKTKIRTIAYSIWDEIGMGARMGSNKVLSEMGIGSIDPVAGTDEFIFWLSHGNDDQQIVVSSKMGGLDTWKTVKPKITSNRFIKDVRSFEPGRELTVRVRLSSLTDRYLEDHNYSGSLLFPTVFGLEAMAQASCYLAGIINPCRLTIENISLNRPIVVPQQGDIGIGISAKVMEPYAQMNSAMRIFAGITTEDSDYRIFHFSAEFVIYQQQEEISRIIEAPDKFLKISPSSDLYSWLLFQGPRFQHIDKVFILDQESAGFTTGSELRDPATECYDEGSRSSMIAGNPLLRDVLLQSVQLYLTKKKYLPVAIKCWDIFDVRKLNRSGIVYSKLTELAEDRAICDVEFISDDRIIERISGYEVKAVESTPDYPDAKQLSSMETVFSDAMMAEFTRYESYLSNKIYYKLYKHDKEFNRIDNNKRHEIEQEVFQSLSGEVPDIGNQVKIVWAANGKPSVENSNLKISLSHSHSVLLMTAGLEEQGCDV
ncbi:MAG TPA: SDR family NAD(P)-dependent oxidoreductase, partial [Bacteroidales bacterium]|nr:SDR family NAD(P)-dependent oxidoreductase [Bacteroidales bacterium]